MNGQQELSVDTPLVKAAYKGQHLNTIATVATLMATLLIAYAMWLHIDDQKDSTRVMKALTVAMREANCLQTYRGAEDQRASFCKQMSLQYVY